MLSRSQLYVTLYSRSSEHTHALWRNNTLLVELKVKGFFVNMLCGNKNNGGFSDSEASTSQVLQPSEDDSVNPPLEKTIHLEELEQTVLGLQ